MYESDGKMGTRDEEVVTVAGFAGGMGLHGNAYGALSATIWVNTLNWCRKDPKQSGYNNPHTEKILNAFHKAISSEILCHKITGQYFNTIHDQTDFVKSGGCNKLIEILSKV
jgi:hypothetical protein